MFVNILLAVWIFISCTFILFLIIRLKKYYFSALGKKNNTKKSMSIDKYNKRWIMMLSILLIWFFFIFLTVPFLMLKEVIILPISIEVINWYFNIFATLGYLLIVIVLFIPSKNPNKIK